MLTPNRSIALVLTLAAMPLAAAEAPVEGRWEGVLQRQSGDLALSVVLAKAPEGGLTGHLSADEAGFDQVPLTAVALDGDTLRFTLPALAGGAAFEGRLAAGRVTGSVDIAPAPQAPSTDIHLAELERRDHRWAVSAPVNLTDREGYDNQPHFLPDGGLLYTSLRDGQTDIYHHDFDRGTTRRVTDSPESEYSPTPAPNGGISVVRVEADGRQRLWRFDLDGGSPHLIFEQIEPVGYHAWIDAGTVALFVLGEPHQLVIAETGGDGEPRQVADSIGRALHRTPGERAVTYLAKPAEGDWRIESLPIGGGDGRVVATALDGREDFVWAPDGGLLMASEGSILHHWPPEGGDWSEVARLQAVGLGDVTRLAVSPDGSRIALVAARPLPVATPERATFLLERR